jgi:beta-aspartyl-peptidase (threonine type)
MRRWVFVPFLVVFLSCGAPSTGPGRQADVAPAAWAIAIHGGAGVPRGSLEDLAQREYLESLERALRLGVQILGDGGSSLDAVERVVSLLEDDPKFNAGKGAVFNREGVNELDASIMNGATLGCGAVAGVRTVKNPISLARAVMEQTRHVLLAGEGAERFALEVGAETVEPGYFYTASRWDWLQQALERERDEPGGGTVGVVALDRAGNLAAGTSTGGLTAKRFGRVGDTPVIGAGTYADNRGCAVSCTGIGEEFIRLVVAHRVSMLVREGGLGVLDAAERVVQGELRDGDGGVIALGADGEIAMIYNTPGMFRGAADSGGRFEVHIWE